MYGFDSIFDMNLRSYTDFVLISDREPTNNVRLADRWRPVWNGIFNEFKDIRFVLHHNHDQSKIQLPDNVEVYTSQDIYKTIKKAKKKILKVSVKYEGPIEAPIKKDEKIAILKVVYDDELVG